MAQAFKKYTVPFFAPGNALLIPCADLVPEEWSYENLQAVLLELNASEETCLFESPSIEDLENSGSEVLSNDALEITTKVTNRFSNIMALLDLGDLVTSSHAGLPPETSRRPVGSESRNQSLQIHRDAFVEREDININFQGLITLGTARAEAQGKNTKFASQGVLVFPKQKYQRMIWESAACDAFGLNDVYQVPPLTLVVFDSTLFHSAPTIGIAGRVLFSVVSRLCHPWDFESARRFLIEQDSGLALPYGSVTSTSRQSRFNKSRPILSEPLTKTGLANGDPIHPRVLEEFEGARLLHPGMQRSAMTIPEFMRPSLVPVEIPVVRRN